MRLREAFGIVGPGLAMAATGVGAGDLIAAMAAGASHGTVVLWAVAVGALLKFALNEGVARWQIATGTTLIEGWCTHLGRPFQIYFLLYLVFWSFLVGGALMSACGVAAHALVPQLSITAWGLIHSAVAAALVLGGRYAMFENVMKALIGVMVLTMLGSLVLSPPRLADLAGLLIPRIPAGSADLLLGLMGGVGGSVTLLAYGYWIRERGWTRQRDLAKARLDLAAGYVLTGLFGIAVMLLAARVLGDDGQALPGGSKGLLALAEALKSETGARLGSNAGTAAGTLFLLGVWGAVFTSTLGVWQGVPYLFADFLQHFRGSVAAPRIDTRSATYRGYLAYLAIAPAVLLFADRPIWVILTYAVASSTFMPLVAGSLLWLNGRASLVGLRKNGRAATAALLLALAVFTVLMVQKVLDSVG